MKPTRQRQKVELFEPHQSAKRARPSPPPKKKKPLKVDVGKLAAALRAFLTGEGDEFENLVSAVVEVDKILAVKSNSKGGLLYQILWVDGTKTWEPEDNVMDDDKVKSAGSTPANTFADVRTAVRVGTAGALPANLRNPMAAFGLAIPTGVFAELPRPRTFGLRVSYKF